MELPQAFLDRMQRLLGDEYRAFLAGYTEPPVSGLRVNTLKISPDRFLDISPYHLGSESTPAPIPWCPSGFTLPPHAQAGKHPFHSAGLYYLQDPSAMAVAELLAPHPGQRVLDLAAAPGGKATHLSALMQNQGLLVANEIHPRRVWELAENLERCGVTNAAVLNETPARLVEAFGPFFDRVLLDAPCSGEAMFRKSEAARREWTPDLVQRCAIRQTSILEDACRLVQPGGMLAYSTCTFAPEENEAVIGGFLGKHAEFELVKTALFPGFAPGQEDWLYGGTSKTFPLQRAVRLWPHHRAAEGHFFALVQRSGSFGETGFPGGPQKRTGKLPANLRTLFQRSWKDTLVLPPPEERLAIQGSYLYRIPEGLPDLAGLKAIHPGWWLGEWKKDRFEPSHALAMGLQAKDARRTIVMPVEEAPLYLRGEAITGDGESGWTVVTIGAHGEAYPLGWGKRVGDRIKNEYPKGLRWLR